MYEIADIIMMDTPSAMGTIVKGKKVRILKWKNCGIYLNRMNNRVVVHKDDGEFCDLAITDDEMFNKDWVVIA
jgi:hypothetical protein